MHRTATKTKSTATPAGPAGGPMLVLVAMTGSLSMIMLDQTVVSVALPVMSQELQLSASGTQWVVNAYVLAVAALVALGGRIGELCGGVTAFRVGVVGFFVASLGCGFAPAGSWGEPIIIAFRVLQGAGAALMIPTSTAIVIDAFPAGQRGRAMAAYVGISQMFLALGPLLGGMLIQAVSWRAVFWLNVPVAAASLVLVHLAGPVDHRIPGTVRVHDTVLLVVGLGSTILAIQQAIVWSWRSPLTWAVLVGGLALTTTFIVEQLRRPQPLLRVGLLGRSAFLADTVVVGLVQFALLPVVLFSSLFLQDVLLFSPLLSGAAVMPVIATLIVAGQVGGRWFDRSGVRSPALTGLLCSAAGLAGWAVALPTMTYAWQVPGMVATGFGLGLVMSPANTDALSRVEPSDRTQASALLQTIRQLGGTIGVAVVSAVVLSIENRGTHADQPGHAAIAIMAGFATSSAAFLIALLIGWRLLSRHHDPTVIAELNVPA